jgi:hypothetical protein
MAKSVLEYRNNRKQSNAGGYCRYLIAAICVIVGNSKLFAVSAEANAIRLQPQALDFVGIYALRDIDPNLTGEGVKFGIVSRSYTYNGVEPQNDYAVPITHPCFADKGISFYDDGQTTAGISPHAAAVASILVGGDANGFAPSVGSFEYEGVAPDANAEIYEFRYFIRDVVFSGKLPNVDVLTMSLGSQFEDWWTRGINRLAEANGITIVAGIGNGTSVDDPVLYPGAGPNVLAVGVVDSVNGPNDFINLANFSLPSLLHSSVGPSPDGRCKPDIVAPANCIAAATDTEESYAPTGNWSSFSTPIVAGTIGLLVQKARSQPDLQMALQPAGNCVLKAIVMNAARKLPFWHKGLLTPDDDHEAPLDYRQGAGQLDAAGAYRQLAAGQATDGWQKERGWDNNQLTPAISRFYDFKTDASAGRYIAATLVWNKHYQEHYPFEPLGQKDSDLRLELWAFDVNNPQNSRLLDYSDSAVDNVEHIYRAVEPNWTNYAIAVVFSNYDTADANAIEQYGLAWDVRDDTQKNSILWYDLNDDGVVNSDDLTLLTNYINEPANIQATAQNSRFDVNMDGKVDGNDVQIISAHKTMSAPWRE